MHDVEQRATRDHEYHDHDIRLHDGGWYGRRELGERIGEHWSTSPDTPRFPSVSIADPTHRSNLAHIMSGLTCMTRRSNRLGSQIRNAYLKFALGYDRSRSPSSADTKTIIIIRTRHLLPSRSASGWHAALLSSASFARSGVSALAGPEPPIGRSHDSRGRASERLAVERHALDHGIDLAPGRQTKRVDGLAREPGGQTNAAAVEADRDRAFAGAIERGDATGQQIQSAQPIGPRRRDHDIAGTDAHANRRSDRKVEPRRLQHAGGRSQRRQAEGCVVLGDHGLDQRAG